MSRLERVDGSLIGTWNGTTKETLERVVKEGVDLYGANLPGANLSGADLFGANLYGANLSGANLSCADLSYSDLSGANLYGADLYRADLSRADLSGANLYGADLSGADLFGTILLGVDLFKTNLSGVMSKNMLTDYTIISSGIESRGNDFYLVLHEGTRTFRIKSGCHTWKSFSEARDHYCNNYTSTGDIKECLARINFLETLLGILL